MRKKPTAQGKPELQKQLLELFGQGPTTINNLQSKISAPLREVVTNVAILVDTGKLEPTSAVGLGHLGPLKCEFRLISA